ncbi:PREDICTED: uncharacterized protein LOC107190810 [Dufourea novaeangliae]|uniref:uncharacterized protein LOC107190810 n=1 Tax=Dufourea novaeangliae TaxID=178035 RepID=UPI0007672368|nr:PREDICTED: uncharacterized protein LOC107190810 [Dufourea novaeangliae]
MPLQHSPKKVIDQQQANTWETLQTDINPIDETMTTSKDHILPLGDISAVFASVESVANIKIPPFWKHEPSLWFIQVESMFQTSRITSDSTKYNHIVSSLDAETMMEVADILRNPPGEGRYVQLKTEIIKRFSDSADQQLHMALAEVQLGDKKPSQLLRQLQSLAGNRASEDVLRVRWLALLPPAIVRCLKILRAASLNEQAQLVDELMENHSGPFIMATHPSGSRSVSPNHRFTDTVLTNLAKDMSAMKHTMHELVTQTKELSRILSRSNSHGSQCGRSRQRSHTRETSPSPGSECFYHRKYGGNAKHCTSPCTFNTTNNQGN